jgi:hypothetical protein
MNWRELKYWNECHDLMQDQYKKEERELEKIKNKKK